MSFETTLICDGCSSVFGGGGRGSMAEELRRLGGRAFDRARGDGWEELGEDDRWSTAKRHLAPCCVNATRFFDGAPVPDQKGGSK